MVSRGPWVVVAAVLFAASAAVSAPVLHSAMLGSSGVSYSSPTSGGAASQHATTPPGSLLPRPDVPVAVTDITPGCAVANLSAPISTSGTTFTLTGSFSGGILDECNGSTIVGNGYTVSWGGTATYIVGTYNVHDVRIADLNAGTASSVSGLLIERSTNVSVNGSTYVSGSDAIDIFYSTGVTVDSSSGYAQYGAYLEYSSQLTLSNDDFSAPVYDSIYGDQVDSVWVTNCSLQNAGTGIYFDLANSVWVTSSNFTGDGDGLDVEYSANIWSDGNVFTATSAGIYLYQDQNAWLSNDVGSLGSTGVDLENTGNVWLSNESFTAFYYEGLYVEYSSAVTVWYSNFSGSTYEDVYGYETQGLAIYDSVLTQSTEYALYWEYSQDLTVVDSNLSSSSTSYEAVYSDYTSGTWFAGNTILYAPYAFYVEYATGWTITGNNVSDLYYTGSAAFYLYEDRQFTVSNNSLWNDPTTGFDIEYSSSFLIAGNNISDTVGDGFYLYEDTDFTIAGNELWNVAYDGFDLYYEAGGVIRDNVIGSSFGSSEGIYLDYGVGVLVVNNSIIDATWSLDIEESSGCQIWNNVVNTSSYGIEAWQDLNTSFVGNTISEASDAFYTEYNVNVWFYHNNFLNDPGWYYGSAAQSIAWDNGYPSGGNYWSNFTTPDTHRGVLQNLAGSDRIVDTPLAINATNIDHYPLAHPWTAPTITFIETGLPDGTAWSVTLNGTTVASTGTSLVTEQTDAAVGATYDYSLGAVAGYMSSPSTGTVAPAGLSAEVTVAFTPIGYGVSFVATGLPAGTNWSVTFGAYTVTGGGLLNFSEPNGSYDYTIAPVPNYAVSPTHGTVSIAGAAVTITSAFVLQTYGVTLTAAGLPAGSSWSITFNGVASSGTGAITVQEPNGTYAYTVDAVSGYTATPASGSVVVAGGASSVGVAFTQPTTSTSVVSGVSTPVFWGLLIALLVAALVAIVALVMLARSRRGRPPAPWTGPGSPAPAPSSGAPPPSPPTGSTPPPGASG